jgi:hypothetical protein
VPATIDQLPRDLRGARGWVFVPEAVFFAKITACVIDTSVSKVLGCDPTAKTRCRWGDTQVQSNNNERVQTCCRVNHLDNHLDETPAEPAKRSSFRAERILLGSPTLNQGGRLMTDQSHLRQKSPLTAIPKVATRQQRTADRIYIAGRRGLLVLLASGVAIQAWALFPSTVESGRYVRLPETVNPAAAEDNSASKGAAGNPLELSRASAFKLMAADLVSSEPTTYGPTAWYPSPVADVSEVSVRSKLQALLMMLYSEYDGVDPAALEAKLQALLTLPDSVLAQLMEHPDLADLNKTLDSVFQGTSDLSDVKTELDKIDVTSVPGPSEKIDVVNVNGKPAYIVHTSTVQTRTEDAAGSPVSTLPPPPGGPVTVTVLSLVQAPALSLVQAPASLSASAFTVAPTSEQLPPPPAPASLSASAFTVAPTSEQLAPPPSPTSTPAATTPTASVEPTKAAQTSQEIMSSGNKFEPGETATQQSAGNSPATNSPATQTAASPATQTAASPATQTAAPSTPAAGEGKPAEAGGVTGGGGVASPSNNESGGTSSGGGTSP